MNISWTDVTKGPNFDRDYFVGDQMSNIKSRGEIKAALNICNKFSLTFSWYKFWFKHQWSWMASDAVAIQRGIKKKSQDENWWHFWLLPIWSYTFGIHLRLKTQEFSATPKNVMEKAFGLQSVIWRCLYVSFTDFMLL